MEMKYVVPDMAQSFGTLEFAGESEPIFERDKNNRKVIARRSTVKGISLQCSCGACQSSSRYGIKKNLYGCRCGLVCKGRGYCIEE